MRTDPKSVGERSEGIIIAAFLRAGKTVLMPFGDNQRYDLVLDEDGSFVRIQCKTGRIIDGAVEFATSSTYAHRGGQRRDYIGQADRFAVYSPELDKVYIVPVVDVGRSAARLRLELPKNGQSKNIRLASDYEFRG